MSIFFKQYLKFPTAEAAFSAALTKLSYKQQLWDVFRDFLDFSLLAFKWWDQDPNKFSTFNSKYTQDDLDVFLNAFTVLGEIAAGDGKGFNDPFGDYFMEHFASRITGQFFTPVSICDLTAEISGVRNCKPGQTICDPTCGSGRTLLAAAKIQREAIFFGADIDVTCCKMTVLNFLMNTMRGEVAWMDSIRMKHWKSWRIDQVMGGNGIYLPYYVETAAGDTAFIKRSNVETDTAVQDQKTSDVISKQMSGMEEVAFLDFDALQTLKEEPDPQVS